MVSRESEHEDDLLLISVGRSREARIDPEAVSPDLLQKTP